MRPPYLLEIGLQFGSELPSKQDKEGNFVYSFNTYSLGVHCVPSTILGTGGPSREQGKYGPFSIGVYLYFSGREIDNKSL